ncbi:unnamed protein product [Chilo suppressalis]|uniref:Uncharacterized protein n=1 Tax=Chilo suppressalis TaxID=168631 RepID=A0ABN8BGD0_CHISP|nr:unnamed protein product [Chilo suppressalis]
MNCAYYQQHGGSHPAPHNVNNTYFNEVSIDPVSADHKDMKILHKHILDFERKDDRVSTDYATIRNKKKEYANRRAEIKWSPSARVRSIRATLWAGREWAGPNKRLGLAGASHSPHLTPPQPEAGFAV